MPGMYSSRVLRAVLGLKVLYGAAINAITRLDSALYLPRYVGCSGIYTADVSPFVLYCGRAVHLLRVRSIILPCSSTFGFYVSRRCRFRNGVAERKVVYRANAYGDSAPMHTVMPAGLLLLVFLCYRFPTAPGTAGL